MTGIKGCFSGRNRLLAGQHIHLGGATHAGNLDPDEWAILRRVIDLIQTNAKGAGAGGRCGQTRPR
jgi:hypothetical protein